MFSISTNYDSGDNIEKPNIHQSDDQFRKQLKLLHLWNKFEYAYRIPSLTILRLLISIARACNNHECAESVQHYLLPILILFI